MKIDLIVFLKIFIQTVSVYYIIINTNDIKVSKYNKFFFFLFEFLYFYVVNFFITNEIRMISYIVFLSILIFIFLKKNIKKSIITILLSVVVITISELIVTGIACCFGYSLNKQINDQIINFIINSIISIFSMFIYFILRKIIKKVYIFLVNKKKVTNYILIIIVFFYLIVARNALFTKVGITIVINMSIIFIFILLLIFVFASDEKAKIFKEMNKQSLNYIKKYEKIITEQGKANHEFKNQLMVIKGYAQMNSPKLMEYLNTLIEESNKTTSTYLISHLNKFPDGGIKGLLYYKLSIMEEYKIKYNIYSDEKAKKKFKNMSVDQINNITKVIGVILDNAIDASKKSNDRSINISLLNSRGKVTFIVDNSYKGNIDKNKIGTGYTTKGKGHGFGLQLTKDIINSKDYLNYKFNIKDNKYKSELEIYTIKKTYKK